MNSERLFCHTVYQLVDDPQLRTDVKVESREVDEKCVNPIVFDYEVAECHELGKRAPICRIGESNAYHGCVCPSLMTAKRIDDRLTSNERFERHETKVCFARSTSVWT